jgi:glycosyltransferase 2 family protein
MRIRLAALAIAGGLAVSAVFAYLAVRDVDWQRFRDALADSNAWWLLPAAATLAVGVLLRALRWRLLFPPDVRPPFAPVLRALLVGTFFNNVLPARPGEAIRVFTLHQETGTSRAAALGTAVAERVLDVVTLLALLFVALPWLPELSWLGRAIVVAAAVGAAVGVAVVVLALWGERTLLRMLRPLARLPGLTEARLERVAADLANGLAGLHRARVAAPAVLLSVVSILVIACSYWLVTLAFSFHVAFGAGLLVMVATNLALVIPSSPAAVGVFEAATLVALHPYGVDRSSGLSYAVVLHALNSLPFVAIGLVLLPRHGLRALHRP